MSRNYISFSRAVIATCLVAMIFVVGCRGSLGIFKSKQGKVNDTKTAIAANREAQVKEAAKHVYATGLALHVETNRSPAIATAVEFNDMAQATLGAPDVTDIKVLQEMITGLLSTNRDLKVRAEKQKEALQSDVIKLQAERDALQDKLTKVESARDEAYEQAAEKAAKYEKWRARLFWLLGIFGGGLFLALVLPALSVAFPVLAPFSAIVTGVAGTVARTIFRVDPKAMTSAGVVGQSAYQLTERTLSDVVRAIDQVRYKDPTVFETKISPELKDATDPLTARPKIREIQQRLKTLSPQESAA